MKIIQWLIAVTLVVSFSAFAQEYQLYNGEWKASYKSPKGYSREGTVIFDGEGGKWDTLTKSKTSKCIGLPAPITVRRATEEGIVFEINRSQALRGCKDETIKLKRVDENTLQGKFNRGRDITLKRK